MMQDGNIFIKIWMLIYFVGWVWLIIFTILVTVKLFEIKNILEKRKK
jgi:hypothetical protein